MKKLSLIFAFLLLNASCSEKKITKEDLAKSLDGTYECSSSSYTTTRSPYFELMRSMPGAELKNTKAGLTAILTSPARKVFKISHTSNGLSGVFNSFSGELNTTTKMSGPIDINFDSFDLNFVTTKDSPGGSYNFKFILDKDGMRTPFDLRSKADHVHIVCEPVNNNALNLLSEYNKQNNIINSAIPVKKSNLASGSSEDISFDFVKRKISSYLECRHWMNSGPIRGHDGIKDFSFDGLAISELKLQNIIGVKNKMLDLEGGSTMKIYLPEFIGVYGVDVKEIKLTISEGIVEQSVDLNISVDQLKKIVENELNVNFHDFGNGIWLHESKDGRYISIGQDIDGNKTNLNCGFE